ncbi:glycerol-3-phosphate dehydrogenase/oxidase [Paragemmobacter straminiformis]|uniref:Glycerol-3-phosphate dehydrogenase/oxidase n=1 Tax=Paragemmobacter straminiformis TaxID=2045119 RepID=A0A842IC45_9RHOB|nr:glycerol-3-phosphate dehydrogenase/oxidase [Gemmobacter straminiformis]MBC2837592.1 glycerol-3-phosphate dehydrogenase/oxidase [Gemmobacter straminiformis]
MAETAEYDAIILGAGINGCGTFRELALQGLRVLLLERGDICQGASAASSRLMHGGLKYLETGEFRLVRESLTERNMLLATAPHYVHPLECVVPLSSTWGGIAGSIARFFGIKARINDRGYVITALGLQLYDIYGRALRSMPRHRMLRGKALRRMLPDLAPAITGAGIYYEGQITHAERLGLELVIDAEAANPDARCETHVDLTGAERGTLFYRRQSGETVAARAPVIVNAGGAWIDRVNAALGIESRLMGGSRGSHLIVDNPDLLRALGGRMIYFGTPDGRVNLVYPFDGKVMVGSTDIPQPDPDTAACSAAEEAYLCAAVASVFPDIPVTPDQIAFRFSGVRPLPRADGDIGLVTRDHSIATLALPHSGAPVHCLIGGKWTTFRAFSEMAADRVLADLGKPRRISTAGMPIGGGRGFPRDAAGRTRLVQSIARLGRITTDRAETLLSRYGTRADAYVATLGGKGETMLSTLPDYAAEELLHIARTEKVGALDDLIQRRTLIALSGRDRPEVRAEIGSLVAPVPQRVRA